MSRCGPCRCSTATAGAASTRSPPWAEARHRARPRARPPLRPHARRGRHLRLHGPRRTRPHPRLRRRRRVRDRDQPALRLRRRPAPHHLRRAAREGAGLDLHADLRPHRDRSHPHRGRAQAPREHAEGDALYRLKAPRRTPLRRRRTSGSSARAAATCPGTTPRSARSRPAATWSSRATGTSPRRPPRSSATATSIPATSPP